MNPCNQPNYVAEAVAILASVPPIRRADAVWLALSFELDADTGLGDVVPRLRSTLGCAWEVTTGSAVPIKLLRATFAHPFDVALSALLGRLSHANPTQQTMILLQLIIDLAVRFRKSSRDIQPQLFDAEVSVAMTASRIGWREARTVRTLTELIHSGERFATIYADPPWPYENEASRAAAVNHYPTMSVEQICAEPVAQLAEDRAHLHLWTTNAFLSEALQVLAAWGFKYKSCLVWVKEELGMGNYWRVSHEYLLLGVRGQLTFRDRTKRSWLLAPRTQHSHKPAVVRALIEQVSPGPYLEMYGREELPASDWTVYGNQVERRLF